MRLFAGFLIVLSAVIFQAGCGSTGDTTTTTTSPWQKVAVTNAEWLTSGDFNSVVVFNNKMWVLGNKVYSSADGKAWQVETASAPWASVDGSISAQTMNGKIWVIAKEGTWSSVNGADWVKVNETAPWSATRGFAATVLNNKIWVMGGGGSGVNCVPVGGNGCFNDVWFSENGANWTEATASAQWHVRMLHSSVAYQNKLWVIGGLTGGVESASDAWSSSDGTGWSDGTTGNLFTPRHGSAATVFKDRIWLLGGALNFSDFNDVWYLTSDNKWTKYNEATPWEAVGRRETAVVFPCPSSTSCLWVLGAVDTNTSKYGIWYLPDSAVQ